MDDKRAQFLPEEETREFNPKPKTPEQLAKEEAEARKTLKNKWRDFTTFTRSVWDNPHETNVDWHRQNAERLKRGRGGRKLNWFELAKLTPELRSLYGKMR